MWGIFGYYRNQRIPGRSFPGVNCSFVSVFPQKAPLIYLEIHGDPVIFVVGIVSGPLLILGGLPFYFPIDHVHSG